MPVTYSLIASNTLSTSAASVTFSSIPSTYTDLVLKMSVRVNTSGSDNNAGILLEFNGSSAANYSRTNLRGNGSAAASFNSSSGSNLIIVNGASADLSTSNTFSNVEVYLPSYAAAANKPFSSFAAEENNVSTPAYVQVQANLWSNTSAINAIKIFNESTVGFFIRFLTFIFGII
jgi:hypothetical protein